MPRQSRRSLSPLEARRQGIPRQEQSQDCRLCNKSHNIRKCLKFKRMNVSEKIKVVKRYRYCENCLGLSHSTNRCRNTDRCRYCKGKHHTLLHRHKRITYSKAIVNKSISSSSNHVVTLLPTVVVKMELGKEWRNLRGLLNPGEEISVIAEFLIKRHKLVTEDNGSARWCKLRFRPRHEDTPIITVTAKITTDLPRKQPKEQIDERVSQLYSNLRLADSYFYKHEDINFIFGADVYPRLIKSAIQPESVGTPMAQDTILGWTIIGKLGI